MTLNDSYPQFQGHAIFNAEYLRKGTIYRQFQLNTNREAYTRPTQQRRFEWPMSDVEWFSKIFDEKKRRAVSLRQLSLLSR